MNEIYLARCGDCSNVMEVSSPATLTCQKCGCGTHIFEETMVFECIKGHRHISKISNAHCEQCDVIAERTLWRSFELQPVAKPKKEEKKVEQNTKPKARKKSTKQEKHNDSVIKTRSGLKKKKK